MTNPFGHNPFQPNPFNSGSVGMPGPPPPTPAPMRPRDEANVLATLSVVFAFVFAPVGAILGHLGLSQIRQTGERGRDRALVGVTLSYVFITVAVVALVVWASLGDTASTQTAATTTAAPTSTTTTTTPPPPPPPTVAPSDLEGLVPTLDDAKNLTGDHSLTVNKTYRQITRDPADGDIDRPECWAVFDEGAPEAYDVPAINGFFSIEYLDTHDIHHAWQTAQGVVAFHDAAKAQAQLASVQSQWRQCGGSDLKATSKGHSWGASMSVPADAGNGITTMEITGHGLAVPLLGVRAIAAKDNIVIDVLVSASAADFGRLHQMALDITNSIFAKIPG
jgi:eukaryotic-like serine/threonine-protein kinase